MSQGKLVENHPKRKVVREKAQNGEGHENGSNDPFTDNRIKKLSSYSGLEDVDILNLQAF